jgi:hypothetical protein
VIFFRYSIILSSKYLNRNTTTITRKNRVNGNTLTETNKGVRQGCPLSSVLFKIYSDKVIKNSLQMIKQNISAKDLILNTRTILFEDGPMSVQSTEDELQRAVYAINNIDVK